MMTTTDMVTGNRPKSDLMASTSCIRVALVDDHPIVRLGLRELIEAQADMEVCGEAASAGDAIRLLDQTHPDLVVVDLSSAGGNVIDLIKQLRACDRRARILVASTHDESIFAERAIRAGAVGYVNKSEATAALVSAIRQVIAGQIYLSSAMTGRMLDRAVGKEGQERPASQLDALSDREIEIFELIGRGQSVRQIADKLHLSVKTVDTYRRHIKDKLHFDSNNELTVFAANWVRDNQ